MIGGPGDYETMSYTLRHLDPRFMDDDEAQELITGDCKTCFYNTRNEFCEAFEAPFEVNQVFGDSQHERVSECLNAEETNPEWFSEGA